MDNGYATKKFQWIVLVYMETISNKCKGFAGYLVTTIPCNAFFAWKKVNCAIPHYQQK